MNRRTFLQRSAMLGGSFAVLSPFEALGLRTASGQPLVAGAGYGPLVLKGDLWLPAAFNYQVLSRQGQPMSDGQLTPGIFDGMGAFSGPHGTTILIRNHENRERAGEFKVVTGPFEYDPLTFAGNTKLEVRRTHADNDPITGERRFTYEIVRDFAILGGTSTNCAGGLRKPHQWLACEEVVKRSANGKKHGYIFEIDARADGPVPAIPVTQAGRRAHEAALEYAGIVYMTEDRPLSPDPILGLIGACFYRYLPKPRGGGVPLHSTRGALQALKIVGESHANMDVGRLVGVPHPVEWVDVDEPDHDDDTDDRRDRAPGFTPNRIQAQDQGAAFFDRMEGMWADKAESTIFFDCTTGGALNHGQIWQYNPRAETITLLYESNNPAALQRPDNIIVVPQTGDCFLQEDGAAEDGQFVRGLTHDGVIYNFARTAANDTEFCGGCFDPDGHTLYLNQQGTRGGPAEGPPNGGGVTYAIYGPFENRAK
jgi:secreted PhoX family phosphatase